VTHLKQFNISSISRDLNGINFKINLEHHLNLPCLVLLSNYCFKKRFVKIMPNGDIQGGFIKMLISLIDFSFVRSLAAPCYSIKSPPVYDPPSIFLLELFRYIDRFQSMDQFLEVLRDKDRGRHYRTWAGICMRYIPTKGTFSNFKSRLGPDRYNEIFHILVGIFHKLQMITFNVIAHDGTLFRTRAKYKGCAYFSKECACIDIKDIISRVKRQIVYRLNNLNKVNLEKSFKAKAPCPSLSFPDEDKRPKLEVLVMKLVHADEPPSDSQINTAILFGVKELLEQHKLNLVVIRSNISQIVPDQDRPSFCCYKLPKDTDARIGVRNHPVYPNRKQKIFGYNLILSVSVESDLKLELPVAACNIAGNADEGSKIITNVEQIHAHHNSSPRFHLADAKYDSRENYEFIRNHGSVPIIDYNPRRENRTLEALHNRGYDENGWPYAPCGLTTAHNGFDCKRGRHSFCCFKKCLGLKAAAIKNLNSGYDLASCPFLQNSCGFSTHSYIKNHPRLINELLRGTKRYNEVKKMRSAVERINSVVKEDLKIIQSPIIYNKVRADILAQIAAITLLLYRALAFIVKISVMFAKCRTSGADIDELLQPYFVSKSVRSLLQLE
jgi:hypothetical protein